MRSIEDKLRDRNSKVVHRQLIGEFVILLRWFRYGVFAPIIAFLFFKSFDAAFQAIYNAGWVAGFLTK